LKISHLLFRFEDQSAISTCIAEAIQPFVCLIIYTGWLIKNVLTF